jgi:hypothetical protein
MQRTLSVEPENCRSALTATRQLAIGLLWLDKNSVKAAVYETALAQGSAVVGSTLISGPVAVEGDPDAQENK